MTGYKTTLTDPTGQGSVHHDFGINDAKHRWIGAHVRTWETDAVDLLNPERAGYWRALAPGHYFVLDVQATRNGVRYGASQRERYFTTRDARDKALQTYLRDARKRAMKNAR